MDQTKLSILLGICGTVLSTAFLALAIVDRRRALLDARLEQFPESPLKRPRDSRRPANSPPQSWSPQGQQRESERVVVGPAQSNQSFSMIIVRIVGMVLPVLVGAVLAHQGIVQRKTGLFLGAALGLTLFALPVVWVRRRVARQG